MKFPEKIYTWIMEKLEEYNPDRYPIPKTTEYPTPKKDWLNPVIGKCSKCGLELRSLMWYCCQRKNCPVFKKGTL